MSPPPPVPKPSVTVDHLQGLCSCSVKVSEKSRVRLVGSVAGTLSPAAHSHHHSSKITIELCHARVLCFSSQICLVLACAHIHITHTHSYIYIYIQYTHTHIRAHILDESLGDRGLQTAQLLLLGNLVRLPLFPEHDCVTC